MILTYVHVIDDQGTVVVFEGVDVARKAKHVTFAVDARLADDIPEHDATIEVHVEDWQILGERMETMDEHFGSPFYVATDPISGRANND